jgi:hypothetical protein
VKRLLAVLVAAGLLLGLAASPAGAVTGRVAVHCDEYLQGDWTGGREWIDESFVYHARDRVGTYTDVGDVLCAGVNHAALQLVNVDLVTGTGNVLARGHIVLAGLAGGWDGLLNAHMTPGGPYIWEGTLVANGFGELAGRQYRADVAEVEHWWISIDGVVFEPGT